MDASCDSPHVVVTGGSGLVPGLKEMVKASVLEAFEARSFARDTIAQVKLQGAHLPDLSFKAEAEYARRAVCLGRPMETDRVAPIYKAWNGLPPLG